ncbi:MAG: methyltransferase domain-containing protein [Chloroflexaceae bacterium]|nr:methyltransferase domain-containing protein [Chloroflexaceae bacterium]NJO04908.1 methyltransferase domain-containing protein [Chloroflexaceae bacterium]
MSISMMPNLSTREGIIDYLLSFDLFGVNTYEGYIYVHDAIGRILQTMRLIPPAPAANARLLELGANPYFMTLLLKKFHTYELRFANYFGEKVTQPCNEQTISSEKYNETHTFQYEHFNVELQDFLYEDASFDGVLFCEILEHLTCNPMHTLNEIHRVLKPGGFVIVTTPNMLRWEHLRDLALGRNINDPYSGLGPYGRHNREYTPSEVINLLQDSGFVVEKIRLANLHQRQFGLPYIMSALRSHWCDHILTLARSQHPPRSRYAPWLYRSMVDIRCVTSNTVIMGQNDELHIGSGWHQLEDIARWTMQRAEVFLRAEGGENRIITYVSSDGDRLGPISLTLHYKEHAITQELPTSDFVSIGLNIPPCDAGEEVAVLIEVDRVRSAASIGKGRDVRQIGAIVQYIKLTLEEL